MATVKTRRGRTVAIVREDDDIAVAIGSTVIVLDLGEAEELASALLVASAQGRDIACGGCAALCDHENEEGE